MINNRRKKTLMMMVILTAFVFVAMGSEIPPDNQERRQMFREQMRQRIRECEDCSSCMQEKVQSFRKERADRSRDMMALRRKLADSPQMEDMKQVNKQIRELAAAYNDAEQETDKDSIKQEVRQKVQQRMEILQSFWSEVKEEIPAEKRERYKKHYMQKERDEWIDMQVERILSDKSLIGARRFHSDENKQELLDREKGHRRDRRMKKEGSSSLREDNI